MGQSSPRKITGPLGQKPIEHLAAQRQAGGT